MQDTLERAWRHRESFETGSNLRAWLFSILRNRFTDEYRRHVKVVQDVEGENAARMISPANQHWRAQYSDLIRAINRLPQGPRDALLLVIGAGLSHEEAAAVIGCPLGTLKSWVRRARADLLAIVEIEEGGG